MHDTARYIPINQDPETLRTREIATMTHDQMVASLRDTPDIHPQLEEMLVELGDTGKEGA